MEECDDELSEWTDDEMMDQDNNNKIDEDYDDDDDDEILKDMDDMTPNDPTILQIRKNQNENENQKKSTNFEQQQMESILYLPEVTQFEALISALMGVDTIYFKWRTVKF